MEESAERLSVWTRPVISQVIYIKKKITMMTSQDSRAEPLEELVWREIGRRTEWIGWRWMAMVRNRWRMLMMCTRISEDQDNKFCSWRVCDMGGTCRSSAILRERFDNGDGSWTRSRIALMLGDGGLKKEEDQSDGGWWMMMNGGWGVVDLPEGGGGGREGMQRREKGKFWERACEREGLAGYKKN